MLALLCALLSLTVLATPSDPNPLNSRLMSIAKLRPLFIALALAVAGVVIAFSLSSTLVKRAESAGVLVLSFACLH
jgi:hypothetical protein